MSVLRKEFNSPFIVDKSKLKRLIEVAEAKFKEDGNSKFGFEAHLSGQKVVETGSVDEILVLDNSKRNRVERLVINCTDTAPGSQEIKRGMLVDFDGRTSASIYLAVKGDSAAWVGETFRAAEEQAERAVERFWVNVVSHNRGLAIGAFLFTTVFLAGLLLALTTLNMTPSRLTNAMWLTDQDLKALEPLQSDPTLAREKAGEVLSRQIRNVTLVRQQRHSILAWVTQGRFIVGITPPLFILAAFAYLYFQCYPNAVFLWGDAEDWYESLKQRRKFIWSGIIGAFAIGVLANLFVLAFASRT